MDLMRLKNMNMSAGSLMSTNGLCKNRFETELDLKTKLNNN